MSLFDDLLTKVQSSSTTGSSGSSGSSSSTGGAGQQQDPLVKTSGPITISESTPIVTNQEVHTMPVAEPVIVTTPVEPPVITITEAPMIGTTQMVQEEASIADTITIEEESSPEESSPLFEMTTTQEETSSNQATNDFMIAGENTVAFIEESSSKNEDTPMILGEDSTSTSPLFDMSDDSTSSDLMSSEVYKTEEEPKVEDTSYKISTGGGSYRNTKEYLKHAYEEVEILIATIDQENEDKIAEREGYRAQKEHFAELENQAELEHQKMLEERAHAKRMKTYLEHEQAKSELPPVTKKVEPTKKLTHIAHAKSKVAKPRMQAANLANFA